MIIKGLGYLVFFTFLLLNSFPSKAQSAFKYKGVPFLRNFSPEDYSYGIQNWSFVQDSAGLLYVGNLAGLMIYDGIRWDKKKIPNNTVLSLAVDSMNTIYLGGVGEFGFLEADSLGELQYRSLVPKVPDDCKDFEDVKSVKSVLDHTYFQTPNYLFGWSGKDINCKKSGGNTFDLLNKVESKILLKETGLGLWVLDSKEPALLYSHPFFRKEGRIKLLERDNNNWLLVERRGDVYGFDPVTTDFFPLAGDSFFKTLDKYQAILFDDYTLVLGTLKEGLVFSDADGANRRKIGREKGLLNETILSIYEDRNNNLWAGTNYGISYIELDSPFRKFDERHGLEGTVLSISEIDGKLYAGTSKGIYRYEEKRMQGFSENNRFQIILDNVGFCNYLKSFGEYLIAGTSTGIYVLKDRQTLHHWPVNTVKYIYQSTANPPVFLAGGSEGLFTFKYRDAAWEQPEKVKSVKDQINSIAEDRNGNVWLGSNTEGLSNIGGIAKILNRDSVEVKKYQPFNSDFNRQIFTYRLNGDLRIGSMKGLNYFDTEKSVFLPDSSFGDMFADSTRQVFRAVEDKEGNVWFRSGRRMQVSLKTKEGYIEDALPALRRLDEEQISTIYPDANGIIWFAGGKGLYNFDTRKKVDVSTPYYALVRKTLVRGDSVIFGGHHPKNLRIQPELTYEDNELRFQYAATSYEASEKTQYQVWLEGFDKGWSNWTSETQKDYTNIPEGTYTFRVRAKNTFNSISKADTFTFTILPPWYRTAWAYIGYVLAIGSVLYGIHKMRLNRILREQHIRNRIASDLHDEVSATLSSISYFAQAIRQSQNGVKAGRFVNLISESASEAKEKITDIIWSIDPENDDWINLLSKCRRFASDMLESKGIEYELNIDTDIPRPLDLELRQHLWLIFKEIITNAARHSMATKVDVIFQYRQGTLLLKVQDNGQGFNPDDVNDGNGIKNLKNRAEQIDAELTLKSDAEIGTQWVLRLDF